MAYMPSDNLVLRKAWQAEPSDFSLTRPDQTPNSLEDALEKTVPCPAEVVHDPALFWEFLYNMGYQHYNLSNAPVGDPINNAYVRLSGNYPNTLPAYVIPGDPYVAHSVDVDPDNPSQYLVTFFARLGVRNYDPQPAARGASNATDSTSVTYDTLGSLEEGYFDISVDISEFVDADTKFDFGLVTAANTVFAARSSYLQYRLTATGFNTYIPSSNATVNNFVYASEAHIYRIVRELDPANPLRIGQTLVILDQYGRVIRKAATYYSPLVDVPVGDVALYATIYNPGDSVRGYKLVRKADDNAAWLDRYGTTPRLNVNIVLPAFEASGPAFSADNYEATLPAVYLRFWLSQREETDPPWDIFDPNLGYINVELPPFSEGAIVAWRQQTPNRQPGLTEFFNDTFSLQALQVYTDNADDGVVIKPGEPPEEVIPPVSIAVDFGQVLVNTDPAVTLNRPAVFIAADLGAVNISEETATLLRTQALMLALGVVNVRNMINRVVVPVTEIFADMGAVNAIDEYGTPPEVPVQYVLNLANGEMWTYEGFLFANPQDIDGVLYGERDGYLYKTGVEYDDDGAPIGRIRIDFGGKDFGTATMKNLDSIWAGVVKDIDAQMNFEVSTDRDRFVQKYIYPSDNVEPTCRGIVGRGLSGRTWRVVIDVSNAKDFELDLLEYSVAVAGRRRKP